MTTAYLQNVNTLLIMLALDIIAPMVIFISKRKDAELTKDGAFYVFVITVLVGNGIMSHIIGVLGYLRFDENPQHSPRLICILSFVLLCMVEGFIYYRWMKKKTKASIKLSMSPSDYKELILTAEKGAKEIWLISKRLHVMFKTPAFIRYLAEQRFGNGSDFIRPYESEHMDRKNALYQGLNDGMIIRELHNKDDLISYIIKKSHRGVGIIKGEYFIDMLEEWKRVMRLFPNNYYVRLTEENTPLKYELIDKKKMLIHESIGCDSRGRLNAIMIENSTIVENISNDFSQVWERAPSCYRNNESVINFIDTNLLPLLP